MRIYNVGRILGDEVVTFSSCVFTMYMKNIVHCTVINVYSTRSFSLRIQGDDIILRYNICPKSTISRRLNVWNVRKRSPRHTSETNKKETNNTLIFLEMWSTSCQEDTLKTCELTIISFMWYICSSLCTCSYKPCLSRVNSWWFSLLASSRVYTNSIYSGKTLNWSCLLINLLQFIQRWIYS